MRILLSNDDGIGAPGLETLAAIAAELSDDIWIVAPEANKSGAGHSLSLNEPIRMRQTGEKRFAVRGTPTDCVIMAVRHVLRDRRPDLILSGVNWGGNLAEDLTYSGTIACAFEGTMVGIRSIALSQAVAGRGQPARFETARAFAPQLLQQLIALSWAPGSLMNVNFPACAPAEVRGVEVTVQGRRDQDLLDVDHRHDPWGASYYWLAYENRRSNPAAGTDLARSMTTRSRSRQSQWR